MPLKIEVLVISDCPHADEASRLARLAVHDIGAGKADVRTTVIASEDEAAELGFAGSPTFLVNGRDPFAPEDPQPGLACRVYATPEGLRGVPDIRDLRRALKEAAVT